MSPIFKSSSGTVGVKATPQPAPIVCGACTPYMVSSGHVAPRVGGRGVARPMGTARVWRVCDRGLNLTPVLGASLPSPTSLWGQPPTGFLESPSCQYYLPPIVEANRPPPPSYDKPPTSCHHGATPRQHYPYLAGNIQFSLISTSRFFEEMSHVFKVFLVKTTFTVKSI